MVENITKSELLCCFFLNSELLKGKEQVSVIIFRKHSNISWMKKSLGGIT